MREEHRDTYRDKDEHWQHVHDHLIRPALEKAGYDVIPPTSKGAGLIHADIIRHLDQSDLVLADFSTLNPNVLFEAGVRTSIHKPLVILAEKGTKLPFDTSAINTWWYDPDLNPWVLRTELDDLVLHIQSTELTGNALWSRFGVELKSAELTATGSPEDARLALLTDEIHTIKQAVGALLDDRTTHVQRERRQRQDRARARLAHGTPSQHTSDDVTAIAIQVNDSAAEAVARADEVGHPIRNTGDPVVDAARRSLVTFATLTDSERDMLKQLARGEDLVGVLLRVPDPEGAAVSLQNAFTRLTLAAESDLRERKARGSQP
ncbi:hypothetical protein [Luteipulveratus halotolerans]|uniref:hypothetical protein n=1 Tax=Luteipulveratus halotolerans TaxID=1631356 RepID=UPI00068176BF|nr:hypothetical protein [Luteipulveratus halotolerans]